MDYIIESDILRVTVTEAGAQIKSVIYKADGVEHMWNGNPEVWKYHSPVMFPYAGKVKDGRIEIRGQVVENAPQHGFHRVSRHHLLSQTTDSVTFVLTENEQTMAIFPYQFRCLTTIKVVGDSVQHIVTVENTDHEPFTFGVGYHPAYVIPFDSDHSIEDYEFRFSDMESPICLAAPMGLLNGEYYTLGANIRHIPIREGMFDTGSHCMVNLRSRKLGVYEKGSNRAVVCDIEQFPYCLIWSTPGKPHFVCIEPWHSVPSLERGSYSWDEKAAAARVDPGESWSTMMQTSFVR